MPDESHTGELHPRYDWLDQARGFVVLMLITSMATGEFAGDIVMGEPILGPPMYNHGYDYYNGIPAIITFIDVGQPLFVFVMGFVGYTAFMSRLRKRGARSATLYTARRVGLLYALAAFDSLLMRSLTRGAPDWTMFFYSGTFAGIALGSLTAFVTSAIIRNADRRVLLGIGMMIAHALVYEFPISDHFTWYDDVLGLTKFPFGAWGLCTVAVFGSCFGQWFQMDENDPLAGFQKRIAPASMFVMIAAYCMEWMQPSEHHDLPIALQLMAVYSGGLMLTIFFAFGKIGIRFPLLSSFGKNLLIMFALGGFVVSVYWNFLPKDLLEREPLALLLLVGIAPIAVLGCLAVWLDKRGIMVRA